MVGLMNTRLGIFRIDVTKNHNVYSLKDSYKDVVRSLLSEGNGLSPWRGYRVLELYVVDQTKRA